jgi:large subunit ribosomal protein L28
MRVCELTGKRRNVANNVSHANNKTKKHQRPNLQYKRIFLPERNLFIRLRVSTRAIRNINRLGLEAYCKKLGLNYERMVTKKLSR